MQIQHVASLKQGPFISSYISEDCFARKRQLTVSFPNKMSMYGMACIIGSLKNWHKNGAERFIIKY